GRDQESSYPEHQAKEGSYSMMVIENEKLVEQQIPIRNAMNEVLRDAYISDCQRGVDRWNKVVEEAGFTFRFSLPSRRFNRHIGIYSSHNFTPAGDLIGNDEWERRKDEWLPAESDRAYVTSLMKPVYEIGKIANWIAQPIRGVNRQPFEFEYVRFEHVR
ncbi:MAG TPA: benzoyl-CoA 2,3-epoxidase subunit BoxB, partial [Acidobacteriota bacterium]|nr:benzoyl-CoA 2,3-epoxidase subunit BoxB [Acidobacteriota bacterium]